MSDKKSVIYRFCVYGGSWLIWPPVIDDLDRDLFDVWNSSCNERVSYIELYASFTAHTCTSSEYATAVTKPHQVAPNSTFPPSMCNRYTKPNHVSRYRSCLFAPKYFRRKSAKRLHHAACGPQGVRPTGEYYPLELMVIVMFLFQLIRVGKLIHRQCTTDVFLIDWEKVMIVPVGTLLGRLRLVGWLISLLVGWLISWLVGWLV